MRHGWEYIVTAFLGAASLVVSGAVAQATVLGPDPSEGPTTGGTVVTLPVPGAPQEAPFTEVSVGEAYSLALDTQGRAWAWGRNQVGQLGNGSTWDADVPCAVTMPPGVTLKQVSAGDTHSLALDTDGKAWAWGHNYNGQLGNDSTTVARTPVAVEMPPGVSFVQVGGGGQYSLALDVEGNVWGWGAEWYGHLGNGSTGNVLTPVKATMPAGVSFTQLSVGNNHSLALGTDGKVWAWGQGMYGQLGIDSTEDALTPVEVPMPAGMLPAYVYAGHLHSLAIDTQGDAWAWGYNYFGQLGDGSTDDALTPVAVEMSSGVSFTQVDGGFEFSLGLDAVGDAWAWGRNDYGQLGDGSTAESDVPVPVRMPGADATVMVTEVLFGDALGEGLTDNGDGTVSVTTPAHAPGAVDVTLGWIVNGVVQEPVVYPDGFTFVEPAVAPTVTDPADVSVVEGSDAAFTVTVTGTPEPDLQWEISEDSGVSWTAVAGATSATLTLTEVALSADGNEYRVAVFNEAGKVTSGVATLTVIPVPVVPPAVERGERLAGSDRYGTNLALLRATFEAGDPLFVATGAVYADALSAGPAVVVEGGSLALTPPRALDLELKKFLEANKPSKIYVVGGTGAVSAEVADQLGKIAPVERVSGKDRYETAQRVFDKFFANRVIDTAFVATGQDFPDALTASAAGGLLGVPVVLAKGDTGKQLPGVTITALKAAKVKNVHIVGGKGAVNESIASSLTNAGFKVNRLGGKDRYATNLAVNSLLGVKGVTGLWVATGMDFPDALSAAVPAAKPKQRLVLSQRDCIPGPVLPEWIKGSASTVTNATLVGGTGVLSKAVENLTACKG